MRVRDMNLELGFGESLSKIGRHELAILVLEGIRLELSREPKHNRSRGKGRPYSPIGILALRMGVHRHSVRRWTDIREVQASDYNAERLAIMAYEFDPPALAKILRADLDRRQMAMDSWLNEIRSDYGLSPCIVNIEVEEGS